MRKRKIICIYKIISPTGRIYIGQSIDYLKRIISYRTTSKKNRQIRLYYSFKKHGFDNHKFEIVTECEKNDLNRLERYYQELYNCLDKKVGLNCILVSDGEKRIEISDETRKKISISQKNKDRSYMTEEYRQKMRDKNLGKKMSEESKIKMSLAKKTPESLERIRANNKKRIFTEETRRKIGSANRGRKMPQHTRDRINASRKGVPIPTWQKELLISLCSKIVVNCQNGIFYNSCKEAAESVGYDRRYLSEMLTGKKRNKTNLMYA